MFHRVRGMMVAASMALLAAPALVLGAEQEPPMTAEQKAMMDAYTQAGAVGAQHKALAATAGNYVLKIRSWQEPGKPPVEETGTATRVMILDGRVLAENVQSSMMGTPYTGHGMSGYDNVSGKFWTTWNDSMSTGLMVSEGTCDANNACTFHGSWNDPITKGTTKSRMTTRWTSPTTEIFEMFGPGPDGKEAKMMEIVYSKK